MTASPVTKPSGPLAISGELIHPSYLPKLFRCLRSAIRALSIERSLIASVD
jgi:hypothetical protein